MDDTTTYTCQDCGKPFITKQRSRRRFCDECVVARVVIGKTRKDKTIEKPSD